MARLKSARETVYQGEIEITEDDGTKIIDLNSPETGMRFILKDGGLEIESFQESKVRLFLNDENSRAEIETEFGSFTIPVKLKQLAISQDVIETSYSLEDDQFEFLLDMRGQEYGGN